jgi:putative ABC transport system substrate-binding protein
LLAFAAGLKENGYVDGQNVLVEYHWLEGQFEQLPALVNDLVRRRVALIATPSSLAGALAASRIVQFVTLASRHRIAASMANREFAEAGGLMSYGVSTAEAWRQVGAYIGQILKGAKPADLPVVQSTRFEFVINMQTARALGIDVSSTVLARADQVIE